MYDIAIIGLGPAGATLARLLSDRFKVLALDKKPADFDEPGFCKPCGGLLAPDAQKALSRFGLALPVNILVDPQIFSVRTIDVDSGLVKHYQRNYLNLDRHRFDLWLKALIPAGGEVEHNVVCKNITPIEGGWQITYMANDTLKTVKARFVVGADGAASLVRRRLYPKAKLRRYIAIQQWFADRHPSPFYSCVFDNDTTDCYAWGLTKNAHFIFGGAFRPKNARTNFEKLKQKLGAFGFKLENPLKTEACVVLRPQPFTFYTGHSNAFLIGEAAGFISSSSLEGISYALDSAYLLSEVFNNGGQDLNSAYNARALKIKLKLFSKNLKSPFIYHPALRRVIMQSGINSIRLI